MPDRVLIRRPQPGDQAAFLAAVAASRELHHPWTFPPDTPEGFGSYVARHDNDEFAGWFACRREDGALIGVFNVGNIVRGFFQSAYLGYYGFTPHAGKGYMGEALRLVLGEVFGRLKLHRIEANIQPGNAHSIALVRRSGFRLEGFSPRYLHIGGDWRDHERWALLADEWQAD